MVHCSINHLAGKPDNDYRGAMARTLTFKQGFHDGLPIFIGYFPTALAFGLVCRDLG